MTTEALNFPVWPSQDALDAGGAAPVFALAGEAHGLAAVPAEVGGALELAGRRVVLQPERQAILDANSAPNAVVGGGSVPDTITFLAELPRQALVFGSIVPAAARGAECRAGGQRPTGDS